MSKTPNIDSNRWYHMYVTSGPDQALIGLNPGKDGLRAAVYFGPTNLTAPTNRWQMFQINETTYALRCQSSGPNLWLGVKIGDSGEDAPYLARGDVSDDSAFWSIGSWGDDFWYLSNAANGTARLNKKGDGLVEMSDDITAPQDGERWKFDTIAHINDPQYSGVNVSRLLRSPATMMNTDWHLVTRRRSRNTNHILRDPLTLNRITNHHAPPSSTFLTAPTGLSTGAKIGIGASVGVGALIALVVLGSFFWRKRSQNQAPSEPKYEPAGTGYNSTRTATAYELGSPLTEYEMNTDHAAAKYELPSNTVAKVPGDARPAELPGHAVQR